MNKLGLPRWPIVKNPASAGDMGSLPDLGRSDMLQTNEAPVPQQLNPRAATTEALTAWSPCSARREASAVGSLHPGERVSPLTASREKPVQQRRHSTAKNKCN